MDKYINNEEEKKETWNLMMKEQHKRLYIHIHDNLHLCMYIVSIWHFQTKKNIDNTCWGLDTFNFWQNM